MTRIVSPGSMASFTLATKSGLSSPEHPGGLPGIDGPSGSYRGKTSGMFLAVSTWPTKMYSSKVRTSRMWTRSGSAVDIL